MKALLREVESLLETYPELRDGDSIPTITTILSKNGVSNSESIAVAKLFKTASTIDRYWRMVQKNRAELRGADWEKRQIIKRDKAKEVVKLNTEIASNG